MDLFFCGVFLTRRDALQCVSTVRLYGKFFYDYKKAKMFPFSPDCSGNPFYFSLKIKRLQRKAGTMSPKKTLCFRFKK